MPTAPGFPSAPGQDQRDEVMALLDTIVKILNVPKEFLSRYSPAIELHPVFHRSRDRGVAKVGCDETKFLGARIASPAVLSFSY